jgi:hypothetical protein
MTILLNKKRKMEKEETEDGALSTASEIDNESRTSEKSR